jgi:hypothetical protein
LQAKTVGVGTAPRNWHVYALGTNAGWSGATVTWNNSSTYQYYLSSAASYIPPTLASNAYAIDETNTVRNWYGAAWVNNGFELGLDNMFFPYLTSFDAFEFYSSEDPSGLGPKLFVTYQ